MAKSKRVESYDTPDDHQETWRSRNGRRTAAVRTNKFLGKDIHLNTSETIGLCTTVKSYTNRFKTWGEARKWCRAFVGA